MTQQFAREAAWMQLALAEARSAPMRAAADVPVGAILVGPNGEVIASGHNERELTGDPTAHAEVVAIRSAAAALGTWRLHECTLVVTLEPCVLCAGAITAARIDRVVFGAWDEKAGAAGSVVDLLRERRLPHRAEVLGGILEDECAAVLAEFFAAKREGPSSQE
ncbi:tRNA adenosine(34) deaminase TadA [Humidisolicoccus flavus]